MRIVPDGQLAVGMQLPIQAQSDTFAAAWERDAGPAELVAIAQAAERAGLFYVGVCDHVAVPRAAAEVMHTTWYDAVATLGLLAGVTDQIHLLSHVYVPAYRHPLQVAKSFATLDHLSGGRVVLGVGAGHLEGEFDALGVEFSNRGALLDEAIDAVGLALVDEWPTISGPTWDVRDVGIGPRPARQPRPPIWIGGSSAAALRRVGERGDGWLPQGTHLRDLPDAVDTIRRHADAAGRGDEPLDLGGNGPWVHVGEPDRDLGPRCGSGAADRIAAVLLRYRDLGLSHVQVGFPARSAAECVDQIERFGAEVVPQLAT